MTDASPCGAPGMDSNEILTEHTTAPAVARRKSLGTDAPPRPHLFSRSGERPTSRPAPSNGSCVFPALKLCGSSVAARHFASPRLGLVVAGHASPRRGGRMRENL